MFDIKHDGQHKARFVGSGHLTDVPTESINSGVVSLRGVRMVTFLSELNGIELWSTDIGNAYLEAYTAEKLFIVAGPEFGELEGHMLICTSNFLSVSGRRWVLNPVRLNQTFGCVGLTTFISTLLSM